MKDGGPSSTRRRYLVLATMAASMLVAIPSLFIDGAILAILLAALLLLKELTDVQEKGTAVGRAILNGALLTFGAFFIYNIGTMLVL